MKVRHAALAITAAVSYIFGGCSNSPGGSSGGAGSPNTGAGGQTTGSAGTPAANGGATSVAGSGPSSCTTPAACGGNVVGTWSVGSTCLSVNGPLNVALAGLDPAVCVGPTMSGTLNVTGSWTGKADGSYTDDTSTTGTVQIALPAACLNLSGTTVNCDGVARPLVGVGVTDVTCQSATGGGCACTAKVDQKGSMGLITASPQTDGFYKSEGNNLTMSFDFAPAPYTYCVSGSQLTLTPTTTNPVTTGSITLANSGSPGTGGAPGAGGGGGTGGKPSVGGAGNTAGGPSGGGSGGSAGGGTSGTQGPCDIYGTATPCAAAYSMIRRLNSKYSGFLYQVRNGSSTMNTGSGGMTKDIGMTADGFADTATQDAFCMGSTCTVSLLYDQSGNANNLPVAKKGLSAGGAYSAMDDFESSATKGAIMLGGHKVYPLYMAAREGYRLASKGKGMPTGSMAQGIYMLADGTHSGSACCWDFGNVTTNPASYGFMNTLFFGLAFWGNGAGSGPWMMADFEGGVWAGGAKKGDPGWGALSDPHPSNPANPSLKVPFAYGISKVASNKWTLRMANLATATDLTTAYDGGMPVTVNNLGGIVLGVGGDNSNNSWGTFYEGAIVSGTPTSEIDLAVMKNVQAVGYGK